MSFPRQCALTFAIMGAGLLIAATAATAASTLNLTATEAAAVGEATEAEAELSEVAAETGGTISFEVFGPAATECEGTALATLGPVAVNGPDTYPSGPYSPAAAGSYRWIAHYSGDGGEHAPADSACVGMEVAKAEPALAASATAAVTVGQPIGDEATLSDGFEPSGTLTFRAYGPEDPSCSEPPAHEDAVTVEGAGSYEAAAFAEPAPGEYRWTASYGGDANNEPADTACGDADQTSVVAKAEPGLSGEAADAETGGLIHDTVTVSGGFSPGGTVTFAVFAPGDVTCSEPLALSPATVPIIGGVANSTDFATAGVGEYRWTASYGGDANNEPVSLGCGAPGQGSTVTKAVPGLAATATASATVGQPIGDEATLSGGFDLSGTLTFRAYGPGDPGCAGLPAYEEDVAVEGAASYSPAGFADPPFGAYRWTVSYGGDANNEPVSLGCGAPGQTSVVGRLPVSLAASAGGATVGAPLSAAATLVGGAGPTGLLTFTAFAPGDVFCLGPPAFSSTVAVGGPGVYASAPFVPAAVGAYRWLVAYSGDARHLAAGTGCGAALSSVAKAAPTIAGKVRKKAVVGAAFPDWAELSGGHAPTGTITFRIYDPRGGGCSRVASVNRISVSGNGAFRSDPISLPGPGRYRFSVSYSGDEANQPATEPCGSPAQVVRVLKRQPRVVPRARKVGRRLIAIRARLRGATEPSGKVRFRLYRPGDRRCKRRPVFSGGVSVSSNGTRPLGKYLATRSGVYRLVVLYSGDPLNKSYRRGCAAARVIRVR